MLRVVKRRSVVHVVILVVVVALSYVFSFVVGC